LMIELLLVEEISEVLQESLLACWCHSPGFVLPKL